MRNCVYDVILTKNNGEIIVSHKGTKKDIFNSLKGLKDAKIHRSLLSELLKTKNDVATYHVFDNRSGEVEEFECVCQEVLIPKNYYNKKGEYIPKKREKQRIKNLGYSLLKERALEIKNSIENSKNLQENIKKDIIKKIKVLETTNDTKNSLLLRFKNTSYEGKIIHSGDSFLIPYYDIHLDRGIYITSKIGAFGEVVSLNKVSDDPKRDVKILKQFIKDFSKYTKTQKSC